MNDRIKKKRVRMFLMSFIKEYLFYRFPFCANDFQNIVFSFLVSFPEGEARFNALKSLPYVGERFKDLTFDDYKSLGGLFGSYVDKIF